MHTLIWENNDFLSFYGLANKICFIFILFLILFYFRRNYFDVLDEDYVCNPMFLKMEGIKDVVTSEHTIILKSKFFKKSYLFFFIYFFL